MTISSTTRKASYSGNGSTTAFSVSFKYLTKSDIVVELIVDSTGVTTTQVLDTDYSLTSPGDSGTVTMTTAPATGETLLISRQMSIVQETDYVENDPFPANTHEQALDRLTMICQELDESIKRALALPLSSTTSDLSVPEPVAERFLGWNSAGTALENKTIADASTITLPLSLANGGTGSTSASGARTSLGITLPLSLANGGTGSTSASGARTSLGVDSELSDYSSYGLEVTDSGTANAHVLAKSSSKETISLKTGLRLTYFPNVENTSSVTVDVSVLLGQTAGTTVKSIKIVSGGTKSNPSSGDVKTSSPIKLWYDGTDFILMSMVTEDNISSAFMKDRMATAWANLKTDGTVSVRDSYNVSSITDLGIGHFRANFTNTMDNDDFCAVATPGWDPGIAGNRGFVMNNYTTSSIEMYCTLGNTSAVSDPEIANLIVYGGLD